MARPPKEKSLARLQKVLDQISELKQLRDAPAELANSPRFQRWQRDTRTAIAHTFGDDSSQVAEFEYISFTWLPPDVFSSPSNQEVRKAYVRGLEEATTLLESMVDEIKEYWEEDVQSPDTSVAKVKIQKSTRKIFVVHGHDEVAKVTVARFLEKLRLEPVILHEQANKGRTIIEKFEDHADVAFAVVLLTPDDIGGLKDKKSDLKPRARQNVILELGFFLGKLGRRQVCPLVKGDVETPSDYDGVVYTKLDDAGGWKMKLVRELKAAGFDVDANKAI